jgi:hypothetical protein
MHECLGDLNSKDINECTPCHVAAIHGHPHMLRSASQSIERVATLRNHVLDSLLKKLDANMDARDRWGHTVVHYAATKGRIVQDSPRTSAMSATKKVYGPVLLSNHGDALRYVLQSVSQCSDIPFRLALGISTRWEQISTRQMKTTTARCIWRCFYLIAT